MRRALALAVLAALALTGCVEIPRGGPVLRGEVNTDVGSSDLVFLAESPRAGATQEEVILGFLAAGVSPVGSFSIAREYLTTEAAAEWDPGAGVIVRSVPPEVTLTSVSSATATVTPVSLVDEQGVARVATGGDRPLDFELMQVAGEWRISAAPAGVVLSSFHFGQLFRQHTLYWESQAPGRAVADVHWFERTAQTLPARIVDAQLAAPPDWLGRAVTSRAAQGVKRVGVPVIQGGVATVTVSFQQVEQLGSASLAGLAVQLQLALSGVGVGEVRLAVEGLEGSTASSTEGEPLDAGIVDQRPLVLDGDRLLPSSGLGDDIADVGAQLRELGATNYTVGAAGGVAHEGSTATWLAGESDPVTISTDVTTAPTTDDLGWVLLQERSSPQQLTVWREGQKTALPLPAGTGRIAALEIARDTSRIAVVAEDAGASRAWVASIERDESGRPVAIGEPFDLPTLEGVVSDITWTSPTQVAVLALVGGRSGVVQLTLGADAQQLPAPTVAVRTIVGGSEGAGTLRALASDGSLLALRGKVWEMVEAREAVSLLATRQ